MNLIPIGRLGKPYGTAGALRARVEEEFLPFLLSADAVFSPVDGKPAPFFVEEILSEEPPILKLEEVDSKEDARAISGQELLLRESDIAPEQADPEGYRAMIGYTVQEEEAGVVGPIEEVVELPEQIMAVVDYNGRQVLIPINEHFMRSFDPEQRIVYMRLPKGLLDL
jgi:16S rRNA processing protein RimM